MMLKKLKLCRLKPRRVSCADDTSAERATLGRMMRVSTSEEACFSSSRLAATDFRFSEISCVDGRKRLETSTSGVALR